MPPREPRDREPAVLSDLLVIGADAAAVAEAIGRPAATLVDGPSPLIAAEHAGETLDPEALLRAARAEDTEVAVAATAWGSALTRRYAVRDLAVALGAPVVVATPARDGASGAARLVAEAVRGMGVPLAAIVLTGWPDPPPRALQDERALLYELTDVPVFTLGAGERPDWPVDDWALATVGGGPAEPGATPRVALEPYRGWDGEAPGDPRATPRPRIMETLREIVALEGPVLASRAYGLYNRASGGKKLTTVARAPLSSAAYWLAQQGGLEIVRAEQAPWQGDDVLRLPDTPAVVVRELGPRELVEVPLDEVAELMRRLGAVPDRKRAVLDTYGLRRMTARAEEYLGTAEGLLDG